MLIGDGFSFKSPIGSYYIQNGFLKYYEESNLASVYDELTIGKGKHHKFLEFISIDANKDDSIIEICNKYGRLGVSRLNAVIDNDFGCKLLNRTLNPEEYARYERVILYKIFINRMKALVTLIQAREETQFIDMLKNSFCLLLSDHPRHVVSKPDTSITSSVIELFEMRRNNYKEFKELVEYLENPLVDTFFAMIEEMNLDIMYPRLDYESYNIDFGIHDNKILMMLNQKTLDTINALSAFTVARELNIFTEGVIFRTIYDEDMNIKSILKPPNLLQAMYTEIALYKD